MDGATLDTLHDSKHAAALEHGLERLRRLFGGGDVPEPVALWGIQCLTEDAGPGWEAWLDESLAALASRAEESTDAATFRPLAVNYNPYGVHFVDKLLGADVFRMEDGSWQARTLRTPVGELRRPDLDSAPDWLRARAVAEAFVGRRAGAVLFGLPTIASALNIAVNLYGQEIIVAMLCEPEAARHDLAVITGVLRDLHRWYRGAVPEERLQCILPDGRCQPPGYGQLCGCTTQLLSPDLYAGFVAPLDAELLAVYPHGGMIHLCGSHTQHLEAWRSMPELRALQLNDRAAEDLPLYCAGLREDQVLYVNPCAEMPVERILEVAHGRRLVVAGVSGEALAGAS